MNRCPCCRREWMDFNLYGYDYCERPEGHREAHLGNDGTEWVDVVVG